MRAQLDENPGAVGGNDPECKWDVPNPGVRFHQPVRPQQARLQKKLAHPCCGLGRLGEAVALHPRRRQVRGGPPRRAVEHEVLVPHSQRIILSGLVRRHESDRFSAFSSALSFLCSASSAASCMALSPIRSACSSTPES